MRRIYILILALAVILPALFLFKDYSSPIISVSNKAKKIKWESTPQLVLLDKTNSISSEPELIENVKSDIVLSEDTTSPFDQYVASIDKANAGDAFHQYKVAKSLDKCFWRRMPKEEYFENLYSQGTYDDDFIKERKDLAEKCRPLYEKLSEFDLIELKDAWLEASFDGGDPYAAIELGITNIIDVDDHDFLDIVLNAFSSSSGDSDLIERASLGAHLFLSKASQSDGHNFTTNPDFNRADSLLDSWQLVVCNYTQGCNIDNAIEGMRSYYSEYETTERVTEALSLIGSIDSQKWDDLRLNKNRNNY